MTFDQALALIGGGGGGGGNISFKTFAIAVDSIPWDN